MSLSETYALGTYDIIDPESDGCKSAWMPSIQVEWQDKTYEINTENKTLSGFALRREIQKTINRGKPKNQWLKLENFVLYGEKMDMLNSYRIVDSDFCFNLGSSFYKIVSR